MRSGFVRASELYDVDSRTPIAHPAHQATDTDVRRALEDREICTDGGQPSSDTDQSPLLEDDRHYATFDEHRDYRYTLTRKWDESKPTLGWIMLNPSTADETEDDPTIRRCIGYAKDWGYGSITVGNLFALRATDPDELREHPDPVGGRNDDELQAVCEFADKVVAAWGANGDLYGRGREVGEILDADLYALDTTKAGHPVHPLYQPKDAEPEPWDVRSIHPGTDRSPSDSENSTRNGGADR
ncbi:DUF1643 domain-containing protein [Natrinema thermotolerans]|uniref:DUF1643 domain-containing protein n=1 Tax=Natrinema thermotolerans TaxID=121872 RepID=A0AAF0P9D4_9EURY|nr:DUF1643 domain-containing protein [Natrinema thermotolerans]QCC59415.1 DUF1643 domain-containing protein [Natrinema thermotolerans]WMT06386.1 DUF1643 domain-containing protein [Natrinema thermotolerans]